MSEFLVNFLTAGFSKAFESLERKFNENFEVFKVQIDQTFGENIMTLKEQIEALKAGQELNTVELAKLIETSNLEREEVAKLFPVIQSQQASIAEKDAIIAQLLGQIDVSNVENAEAVNKVNELINSTAAQSKLITDAIASIQSIYVPTEPTPETF
jgi:predicted XRE-type DNA-binding protein